LAADINETISIVVSFFLQDDRAISFLARHTASSADVRPITKTYLFFW